MQERFADEKSSARSSAVTCVEKPVEEIRDNRTMSTDVNTAIFMQQELFFFCGAAAQTVR